MSLTDLVKQAARMAARDWRAGELRLLAAALVIAVAAVTSVGFLVDRIRIGLERDATQLLGADAVLSSDRPIGEAPRSRARAAGLQLAETVTFPSMVISEADADATTLAAVKAVSEGYPLRGRVGVATRPGGDDALADGVPQPGTVWVDAQVLASLRIRLGERLRLGDSSFAVARIITVEPDRGAQFINFAPRVMLNLADLPATQLIQPGARVTYRLLAAGEPAAVRAYARQLQAGLARGQQLESLESGRPEMQRTLERAERFLGLVALLAAMIAAVAVAVASRRFSLRHLDSCAMMRCLGLAQRDIFRLFALEFVYVGLAACAVGMAAGFLFHYALVAALGSLIMAQLPLPSLLPALQAGATGLVLLLGFSLPPLAQLRSVPPLRVLRKDVGPPSSRSLLGYLLGLGGFLLLVVWTAGDLKVGALTAGGFAVGVLLFAACAWGVLQLLAPLRSIGQLGVSWRFAVAAVQRRPAAAVVQLVALAVGIMALLLLTVVRTDLVGAWRAAAPPDAPNRFIINIQPDQVPLVERRLSEAGIADAPLHPMVRGRLVAVNGKAIGPEDFASERAQRLVDREFNLTYADAAPTHNRIVDGRWYAADAAELSIEQGIAERLGIRLGDELTFDIAGSRVSARASSLRKVNWDSLRANFFVIMPSRLLAEQPKSYITAFHLPSGKAALATELVREMPNLTVLDTSAIFRQVQAVLDQVIAAIEFLFLFTLAAGVLVLYAALTATFGERVREAGLLRALGASREQLSRAQTAEMVCLGALAGLLAAAAAAAVGWALARFAFEFDYTVAPWVFVLGIGGGIACALAGGWLGLRNVLKSPPLATLREA
jgi:putative ABC transport system permease protein